MGEMRFENRMSDTDALMWSIEKDPLLRSTIVAVSILDQAPDRDRLAERIDRSSRMIARLRQRVVSPPFSVAPPRWVIDPNFDINYHLRFLSAPGAGTMRDLLDLAAPIGMQGFDRARALWEFTVVDGLADGKAAMIQKIHHSVTDGVGGVELALTMLDLEREPTGDLGPMPDPPEAESPTPLGLLSDGLRHESRRQRGIASRLLGQARSALRAPGDTAAATGAVAQSLARLLAPAFAPLSPIMTGRSLSVRFDTVTVPLGELKSAAKRSGGKLNDAFVAAITGGLRRYHHDHGAPVDVLRMAMPISVRAPGDTTAGGNQFVPARFTVPVDIEDPIERMASVRALVAEQRAEPALAFTEPIAGVLNRMPTQLTTQLFGGMLKGIDFTTSNVPGAPFEVFLCGAKIEAQFPFGPLSGAAANITLLSNVDCVHVGLNTDPAAVPDPEHFVACIEAGFDEILKA